VWGDTGEAMVLVLVVRTLIHMEVHPRFTSNLFWLESWNDQPVNIMQMLQVANRNTWSGLRQGMAKGSVREGKGSRKGSG
jgi:hypothetical protein